MAEVLTIAAGWALAGILLLAAAHKTRHYLAFQGILNQYRLLPEYLLPVAAPLIITLEAVIGLALLAPANVVPQAATGLMATLLLCLYTGAIAINLARGHTAIDCGCGGAPTPLSGWLLTRNGLLLGLAWAAATAPASQAAPGPHHLLAAAMAVFLWCAYAIGNQLLANHGSAQLAWGTNG